MKSFSEKLKNLFLISGDPAQAEENAVISWTVSWFFVPFIMWFATSVVSMNYHQPQRQQLHASSIVIRAQHSPGMTKSLENCSRFLLIEKLETNFHRPGFFFFLICCYSYCSQLVVVNRFNWIEKTNHKILISTILLFYYLRMKN